MAAIELEQRVIERELCTGCGTCMGVCPTGAIRYENDKIRVDHDRCIRCGRCYRACPGEAFPMEAFSQEVFGRSYDPQEILGHVLDIWNVKATDKQSREQGASGGVVTQLGIDLLENGEVEGVVAVRASRENPCEFESFIARNRRELLGAARSKYVILPVNAILEQIRKEKGRIAFVGLPCQVQGLRKAMAQDETLQEKVAVIISLFCGFNMEKKATEYLIRKSGVPTEQIQELDYRKKRAGETGFYVAGKNGRTFFLPKHGYTFLNLLYAPKRCWKCFDYSGEFADLSVGDAWEETGGTSRVIVRTERGRRFLERSVQEGTLQAVRCEADKIKKTQKMVTVYKKKVIDIRAARMRTFPEYEIVLPRSRGKERLFGYALYLILCFFKTGPGRVLARCLPLQLFSRVSARLKRKEIH